MRYVSGIASMAARTEQKAGGEPAWALQQASAIRQGPTTDRKRRLLSLCTQKLPTSCIVPQTYTAINPIAAFVDDHGPAS